MSRIEEALKNALLSRNITEKQERVHEPRSSQRPDRGINVLIISRDLHISKLINHLRPLSYAEIITSDNIAPGIKSLFERRPIEIDEYELKFTALMLDYLCCYCESAASD